MVNSRSFLCSTFWSRFSVKRIYFPLSGALFAGILIGAVLALELEIYRTPGALQDFLFSGFPRPELGFVSCFSAVLLSLVSCLIVLFLLGVTAFGGIGVPIFLFFRSMVLGVNAMPFLVLQDGLVSSALCFLPVAAGSSLLVLLFGTRAFAFSNSLLKAGFTGGQEGLNFYFYFKDFLVFVCFAVIISCASSLLAIAGLTLN